MVRAIDKYFLHIHVRVAYREKVAKGSDIVWFFPSACNLRIHRLECVGQVKRTLCFTGAIYVLQCSVVRLGL